MEKVKEFDYQTVSFYRPLLIQIGVDKNSYNMDSLLTGWTMNHLDSSKIKTKWSVAWLWERLVNPPKRKRFVTIRLVLKWGWPILLLSLSSIFTSLPTLFILSICFLPLQGIVFLINTVYLNQLLCVNAAYELHMQMRAQKQVKEALRAVRNGQ